MLVDARFVGERIVSHHRLVRGDGHAGDARKQTARLVEFLGLQMVAEIIQVPSRADRHHQFLDRRVAGTLADAAHSALRLPGASFQTGEGIGDREAQVIVAMDREDRPVDDRHVVHQWESSPELLGMLYPTVSGMLT